MKDPSRLLVFVGFTAGLILLRHFHFGEEQTMVRQAMYAEHRTDPVSKRALGGVASGPGYTINWAGTQQPEAAQPIDVIRALKSRMTHLQTTSCGSDKNARALWEIDKALQILEGDEVKDVGSDVGAGFGGSNTGGK